MSENGENQNDLLHLLGANLYISIPKVIPRNYPRACVGGNYQRLTETDSGGHNVVIAEENYNGKL
jgi:hypothetical protein